MTNRSSSVTTDLFCWWGNQVLRFPRLLLLLVTLLCGYSLFYTINNLGFNMDTTELLSPDLPFQKNRKKFDESFPQEADNILILVESSIPEHSLMASRQLYKLLSGNSNSFSAVSISDDNDFFRQQALLYLDTDKLDELSTQLSDAQPFIGYLAQNYNLSGLFDMISQALTNESHDLPVNLTPILEQIDQAIVATTANKAYFISWQKLLAISPLSDSDNNRHIVIAKPVFNFGTLLPSAPAMEVARQAVAKVRTQYPDSLRISITGGPAVEHEELESLGNDMAVAGGISLFLVCCSLLIGLRSFKLMLITFIGLIFGLLLTAGFATISVGHLNVLSVAFAVLYIGLGVDFSLHVCLRYRECREQQLATEPAIKETIQDMGFSLFLCALTTSIGFFAFIPTNYAGVSELGIISGGGMFIGFFISMIVLPALLKIMPLGEIQPARFRSLPAAFYTFPFKYKKSIRIISLLSAVFAFSSFTQLSFDSNPINLRNQDSDSVKAFHELLNAKMDSPFVLFSLRDNLQQAQQLAQKLKQLSSVDETVTLADLVAGQQDQKLEIIDDLNFVLGADLEQFQQPIENSNSQAALLQLQQDLQSAQQNPSINTPLALLQQLQIHIGTFLEAAKNQDNQNIYLRLDDSILGLLPFTMQQLSMGLNALEYSLDDLPQAIIDHWHSQQQGVYKVLIVPKYDLNDPDNLDEFVEQVQSIDPSVTGYPVIDTASGAAVAEAFIQAFISALLVIFLVLLLILRSFRNTIMVVGPLLLATLLTGALNVILQNPFNFANSIAIPLLMGMGVDSGIHIMHRLHTGLNNNEQILQTSTARGVFFSSLTTLFSFTSLAFIPHAGIASMGLLLSIGITFTLICTLIVLPAFSDKEIHY